MATAFTPLVDPGKYDDPSFRSPEPAKLPAATKLSTNPVVPKELAPESIEDRLKAEGSGTSFLTSLTAWLGAAKGDFRGLQALEEQKRRTALAKAMAPDMRKASDLANSGKWEEASKFVNEMLSSYGQRSPELADYIKEMQARISRKQEGWENLKGVYQYYKDRVPSDSPRYRTVEALAKAVERRDQISETTLQGMLTRDQPHIQYLDNRMIAVDPYSLNVTSQNMPQMMSEARVNNFAGNSVASRNDLNTAQVADVMNNVPVKTSSGAVIQPGSAQAKKIMSDYNNLQPVNAALEVAKLVPLEPTQMLQLLKDHGLMEIATRSFGGKTGAVEKALTEHYERLTEQQIALEKGKQEIIPIKPDQGVVVNLDDTDPDNFLTERMQPTTMAEVKASGGRIGVVVPSTMAMVRKNQSAIKGLDTIKEMIGTGATAQTKGDILAQGVIQKFSSLPYIGYPITDKVEARQLIKTILNTTIEQMENTAGAATGQISGRDRVDIEKLKAFASGDFKSNRDLLDSIATARARLAEMTKMAIGVTPPSTQPVVPVGRKGAQSPASAIAPLVPSKGGQVTRQPYTQEGKINLPPDFDPELIEKIARQALKSTTGGGARGGTVNIPVGGTPQVVTPSVPSTPEGEKAAIKARLDEKMRAKEAARQQAQSFDRPPRRMTPTPTLTPLTPPTTEQIERGRVIDEIRQLRALESEDRRRVLQRGVR